MKELLKLLNKLLELLTCPILFQIGFSMKNTIPGGRMAGWVGDGWFPKVVVIRLSQTSLAGVGLGLSLAIWRYLTFVNVGVGVD